MAQPYPSAILDRIDSSNLGMHSGVAPSVLPPNQQWFGCNLTFRGGKPTSRPPMRKIALEFPDDNEVTATQTLFQGAAFYEGDKNCLLMMSGGRLWRIQPSSTSAVVDDISASDLNDPTAPQAWFFQGEEFMLVNDGLSFPLIFDGAATRRSAGPAGKELPAGCMGHYVNGRIVMALPDRRSFIAGDLVESAVSGTPAYGWRDSILKTTENEAILGGRSFAIPLTSGRINALFSVAIPDVSLGQGPLQIGTRKGIFSFDLPIDANQWTTTQQPSSAVSLPSYGPTSQDSVVGVNSDAWYRSADGIRSFAVARRDFNTWVQTPLSFEMKEILPFDTQHLLEHASGVEFKNRLLMTCSPHRVADRGIAHRGMVALDFNNISSLTMRSQPAYDGLWTGLEILKIVEGHFNGVDRCFLFALDADDNICLYELFPDETTENFDWNGEDDVPIQSWFITNALFGKESYPGAVTLPLKRLITSELFLEGLAGNVQFDVKYRSDQWPFWLDWKTFSICAPDTLCSTDCDDLLPVQRQYATFKRLPEPRDECNTFTKRPQRTGYYFQLRIQWTGRAQLHRLLVWAVPVKETMETVC